MVFLHKCIIVLLVKNFSFSCFFSDNPWRAELYQVWPVEEVVHCTFSRGRVGFSSGCCEEGRWSYFTWFGVRACQGLGISSATKRC